MTVNSIVGVFFFSASFQKELLFGLLIFNFYIASYTVVCWSTGSYHEISLPNLISAALSFLLFDPKILYSWRNPWSSADITDRVSTTDNRHSHTLKESILPGEPGDNDRGSTWDREREKRRGEGIMTFVQDFMYEQQNRQRKIEE